MRHTATGWPSASPAASPPPRPGLAERPSGSSTTNRGSHPPRAPRTLLPADTHPPAAATAPTVPDHSPPDRGPNPATCSPPKANALAAPHAQPLAKLVRLDAAFTLNWSWITFRAVSLIWVAHDDVKAPAGQLSGVVDGESRSQLAGAGGGAGCTGPGAAGAGLADASFVDAHLEVVGPRVVTSSTVTPWGYAAGVTVGAVRRSPASAGCSTIGHSSEASGSSPWPTLRCQHKDSRFCRELAGTLLHRTSGLPGR